MSLFTRLCLATLSGRGKVLIDFWIIFFVNDVVLKTVTYTLNLFLQTMIVDKIQKRTESFSHSILQVFLSCLFLREKTKIVGKLKLQLNKRKSL